MIEYKLTKRTTSTILHSYNVRSKVTTTCDEIKMIKLTGVTLYPASKTRSYCGRPIHNCMSLRSASWTDIILRPDCMTAVMAD